MFNYNSVYTNQSLSSLNFGCKQGKENKNKLSSDDNSSKESIESDPEEAIEKSLKSSSKSKDSNKTLIKTEKQKSIIPNDRTTGTYKKGYRKSNKDKEKHYKHPEENVNDDSLKNKNNIAGFSYEQFPKKSKKQSLDQIQPHKIHQKRGTDSQHSKKQTSTDLQEAPALKYKKVTYLSVVEGESFHKRCSSLFLMYIYNGILIFYQKNNAF